MKYISDFLQGVLGVALGLCLIVFNIFLSALPIVAAVVILWWLFV